MLQFEVGLENNLRLHFNSICSYNQYSNFHGVFVFKSLEEKSINSNNNASDKSRKN